MILDHVADLRIFVVDGVIGADQRQRRLLVNVQARPADLLLRLLLRLVLRLLLRLGERLGERLHRLATPIAAPDLDVNGARA